MGLLPTPDLRRAVTEIEAMGFGAIWIGEHLAREIFAASAIIQHLGSRSYGDAVQLLTPTPDRAPTADLRRLAPLLLS